MLNHQPIPEKFHTMDEASLFNVIAEVKRKLGSRLVILGHHYQRDEIIQFADITGDSLKLSQLAAEQKESDYIVFCGVHFMAESADILSEPHQKVLLPDLTAGCSMADMAALEQVETCWQFLQDNLSAPDNLIPITYVNSSAAIKAFCGRNHGLCCTSGNCRHIFEAIWGDNPDAVILFLPDQHLARNTAYQMGIPLEEMPVWNQELPIEYQDKSAYEQARMILWQGYCSVHQEFGPQDIQRVRQTEPGIQIMVHPESSFEVVQLADMTGSTEKIIQTIKTSPPGSRWAVGTERNLVNRLTRDMAPEDIHVQLLGQGPTCLCDTMYQIDPQHLAWILDRIAAYDDAPDNSELPNVIRVEEDIKSGACIALQKMLDITAARS